MKKSFLLPIMILVVASLLSGIFSGWYRLGFALPVDQIFLHHGAIMTGSFLGTLILMERIVTLQRKWLFAFPLVNVSSLLFYYMGWHQAAFLCLILGALGLFYVFHLIHQKSPNLPHKIMWVGAAAWLLGNTNLLLMGAYAHSILWWMAFLLLTIAGERLELAQFLPVSKGKRAILLVLLGTFVVACMLPYHLGGNYVAGVALLLISLWLMRYDMIRQSIKKPGIHRYSAVSLLLGYVWLGLSGLSYGLDASGTINYDVLIHSFYLGFVFSMIFAHAPFVLPGILKLSYKPYHPILYLWISVFHASLLIRLLGSMLSIPAWKQWGGLANGLCILLFMIQVVTLLLIKRKRAINQEKQSMG
ncbi:hypothetical protein [Reichenbachiella ulvae]|uniref:NnrS protein n=1 Tax=Reichenbachiella ulvae TaxID=2980104 RepID=A0ABT3CXE7_9BACT|nr:hypothetical protein [Reichenbachiella ulvae]MCV9387883.1 hypothetical protein [Reichenbachiella ulvae]